MKFTWGSSAENIDLTQVSCMTRVLKTKGLENLNWLRPKSCHMA